MDIVTAQTGQADAPDQSGRKPLRVAVLLDSQVQPAWLYAMLERVRALAFVELCLVIKRTGHVGRDGGDPLLWSLYRRIDDKLFGRGSDALGLRDMATLTERAPAIELASASDPNIERIVGYDLDVILDLAAFDSRDELRRASRHGLWRYEFGHRPLQDASAVGLREVVEGLPLTDSALVGLMTDGTVVRLYGSQSRTVPFSPRRNRDNVYWKSAAFAARALTDLYWSQTPGGTPRTGQPEGKGGRPELARVLAQSGAGIARRGMQKLAYIDQWFVAFRFGNDAAPPDSLTGFLPMMPPKDRFWADPFPIERDGRHFVFIEELPFATNKGHISVMEVWPDGRWTKPIKVLERDYHLSYPFLFEWQGALFMIPETGQNRTVEVYRCHRFPDDWRLESVLLENRRTADATLASIGDRWWMFVNIGEDGTELYDELHLFHADQPFGKWTPHRGNPVKSDALSARPAGNLFQWQGELYRPAQVCAPLYGTAIALNKIERLDPDHFVEREVRRLDPAWQPGLLGCHTYNRAGGLTVVDGFRRTPRWGSPA